MQQEHHPSSEKKERRAHADVGTVTIHFRPTPDAKERLRRVYALILARTVTLGYSGPQVEDTDQGEVLDED